MLEFIRTLVPTLFLFSLIAWRGIEKAPIFSESFGDSENYLTLNFERNPAASNVTFQGRWTTEKGDRVVIGEKRNARYVIDLPEGRFVGSLKKSSKGCEPFLQYTVEKGGVLVKHGRLRGAFCL